MASIKKPAFSQAIIFASSFPHVVHQLQLGERREDIFRVSKERAIHERLGVLVEEAELVNRLKDGAFTEDSPRGVV